MNKASQSLIDQAQKLTGLRVLTNDLSAGNVACALKTATGQIFTGINLKSSGNLGFCAEVSALMSMIEAGETQVTELVAINESGKVIPPCGRCRELLYQTNRANLMTKIILSATESVTLEDLLPHPWQVYWGDRV